MVARDAVEARIENGVQTVMTEFKGGRYVPFTVQAGLPLKWTIRVGAQTRSKGRSASSVILR